MRNDNKLDCKEVELNARDSQNLLLLVLSPPVLTGFLSQGGAKLRDFLVPTFFALQKTRVRNFAPPSRENSGQLWRFGVEI